MIKWFEDPERFREIWIGDDASFAYHHPRFWWGIDNLGALYYLSGHGEYEPEAYSSWVPFINGRLGGCSLQTMRRVVAKFSGLGAFL